MPRAPHPRRYLADTVYEALRRAIVERKFDPGEALTEQELSRRFDVSRTPVREALAKLERDGLVRVVPKKGAFVRTLSHDEIRELYQLREALEALAVRLAAPRLDPGELAGFEARFKEVKAQGPKTTYAEVRALGEEFHRHLTKKADNSKLTETLEQIREHIRSMWNMSIVAPRGHYRCAQTRSCPPRRAPHGRARAPRANNHLSPAGLTDLRGKVSRAGSQLRKCFTTPSELRCPGRRQLQGPRTRASTTSCRP
jgi:DNA-binding GntR family transcriptional regulator